MSQHNVISHYQPLKRPIYQLLSPFIFQVSYSDTAEGGDRNSDVLKKSVDEIKRLQEEVSALRQENLQLKVNRVIKKK